MPNVETFIVVAVLFAFFTWGAFYLRKTGKRLVAEHDLDGKIAIWVSRFIFLGLFLAIVVFATQVFDLRMPTWRQTDLREPVPAMQTEPESVVPRAKAEPKKELEDAKQIINEDLDEWLKRNRHKPDESTTP